MIVVVNYGVGNMESVLRAFHRLGAEARLSAGPADIAAADHLILPGVGFFDKAMGRLRDTGLLDPLHHKVVEEKTPVLGICLGFQMLTRHSEEGDTEGLGWIDAETKAFDFTKQEPRPKVPHIGWNQLAPANGHALFDTLNTDSCYYFAHSYYVTCNDPAALVATTDYGLPFASVVQRDNIFGTQFHPEKSHDSGTRFLQRFLELT